MSLETHPLSIHGLLYNKLNLFTPRSDQKLSVRYIDTVLEEAMQIVYEICVDNADINHRVVEDLRPLTKDYIKLSIVRQEQDFTVYALPEKYFRTKRVYGTISKAGCPERKLSLWKARANEINNLLEDDNWKPTFQWGKSFYDSVSDGIKVFHNGGFRIEEIRMDYYKMFTPIRCPANEDDNFYTWYEGTKMTTNQETEFSANYLIRRFNDVAVAIVNRDKNDPNFALKLQSIMSFENLYK